uniref:(northern house mosquito) hypothetical protein n=1 Tax=Culex pipiens TaxID=7175 RepID=A0A8D8D0D0_CULPI
MAFKALEPLSIRCVARASRESILLCRARAALASQTGWFLASLRARHTYFVGCCKVNVAEMCVCWVVECGIFLFCFLTKKHRIQSERSMVRVRLINLFLLLVLVKVGRFVFFFSLLICAATAF